jgi:hypothetical protein
MLNVIFSVIMQNVILSVRMSFLSVIMQNVI